jgi:hypothetical protein
LRKNWGWTVEVQKHRPDRKAKIHLALGLRSPNCAETKSFRLNFRVDDDSLRMRDANSISACCARLSMQQPICGTLSMRVIQIHCDKLQARSSVVCGLGQKCAILRSTQSATIEDHGAQAAQVISGLNTLSRQTRAKIFKADPIASKRQTRNLRDH